MPMLFLPLISAEYIKLLTSDMYVGVDWNGSLTTVHRDNATRFERESINGESKSPFTKIKGPGGKKVDIESDGRAKLSRDGTDFLILLSKRGGFFISKGDKCLGHGKSSKIELGNCSDNNFNSLFIFMNNRDGARADVRLKSKGIALNVKPVTSFGRHFHWCDATNADIERFLSPFADKPVRKNAKYIEREFLKFNEF